MRRLLFLSLLLLSAAPDTAAADPHRGAADYEKRIRPILEQVCFDCHADGVDKGDFAFDAAKDLNSLLSDLHLWDLVRQQLTTHVMPPEGKDQPTLQQRDDVVRWIDDNVFWMDPEKPDPGQVTRRRLNRVEYNNTIRDLLYLDTRPADAFPPDDSGYGFDTIGDVLSVSPLLMEKYVRAAFGVAEAATALQESETLNIAIDGKRFYNYKDKSGESGPSRHFSSESAAAYRLKPAFPGTYTLELHAAAAQAGPDPARMNVRLGKTDLGTFDITTQDQGEDTQWQIIRLEAALTGETELIVSFTNDFYDATTMADRNLTLRRAVLTLPASLQPPKPTRFLAWLLEGKPIGTPSMSLTGEDLILVNGAGSADTGALLLASAGTARHPLKITTPGRYRLSIKAGAQQAGTDPAKFDAKWNGQTLAAFDVTAKNQQPQWFQHEFDATANDAPLELSFLNDFYDEATKQDRNLWLHQVRIEGPIGHSALDPAAVPALATRMASRLYRRPLTQDETQRWAKLAQDALAQGESPLNTLRLLLEGLLVSPGFLYHSSPVPTGPETHGAHLIDEFTLASRLSYFLWSAPPDDKLLDLAAKNQLRAQLPAQVDRMITDWRARALTENFTGQWLQLRDLGNISPDYERFKDFYKVQYDLRRETETFFENLIKENLPVLDLLNADYTYANERLAKYYGLPSMKGDKLEKVSLTGTPRGGILTHGSVLAITSTPTRTSPVKRGKFLLENILGTPPPPAPEGVPPIDERKGRQQKLTLREQLAAHRENPSCAGCHAFLDPVGFAFENFDPVGQYRTEDNSKPIDASGQLVRGQTFQNLTDLRTILARDMALPFVRNLADNLLIYALGRGTTYADRPALDAITRRTEADGWKTRTLLLALIESAPFQRMRSPAK
jgi:mono/diheme cytochrome c family protein